MVSSATKEPSAPKVSASVKYVVEKFDGKKVNFGMWQCQMRDILVQQDLHRALKGKMAKLTKWSDDDWDSYNLQACSTKLRI